MHWRGDGNTGQGRKKKVADKLQESRADDDGLHRPAEKVAFGDVVQRPHLFSDAALKSRAKLLGASAKRSTDAAHSSKDDDMPAPIVRPPVNKRPAPSNFEEYAAKVREAYRDLKKRRAATAGGH